VYFEYICWKFAGRLQDRANNPLRLTIKLSDQTSKHPGNGRLHISRNNVYI